jgi:hypothetical protein
VGRATSRLELNSEKKKPRSVLVTDVAALIPQLPPPIRKCSVKLLMFLRQFVDQYLPFVHAFEAD